MTLENAEKVSNLLKRLNYLKDTEKKLNICKLSRVILISDIPEISISEPIYKNKIKENIISNLKLEIELTESELDLF